MDWSRAKNYTIISLLILNVILFSLNFISSRDFILKQSQIQSVESVLFKNNIKLESDIPSRFNPLSQLYMKNYDYDILAIQKLFFSDTSNIKRTDEFDKKIFSSGNENIIIKNNTIYFENNNKDSTYAQSRSSAIKKAAYYIDKINIGFTSMNLDRAEKKDDYFVLEYSQRFNNYSIFNNYAVFYIMNDGRIKFEFKYNEPLEQNGPETDICSADEALFVFMSEIKLLYGSSDVSIQKMDLGYFASNVDDASSNITAVPHYRIFIDKTDKPIYINAYNSTIVPHE